MIPLIAEVRVKSPRASFRIWAPLFLIWLLLLPLVLVLAPFALLVMALLGRNPVRVSTAAIMILHALSGVLVEVESPAAQVLVRIQ